VSLFRRSLSLDVSLWQDLREADQPPIIDEAIPEEPVQKDESPHLTIAGRLPPGAADVEQGLTGFAQMPAREPLEPVDVQSGIGP